MTDDTRNQFVAIAAEALYVGTGLHNPAEDILAALMAASGGRPVIVFPGGEVEVAVPPMGRGDSAGLLAHIPLDAPAPQSEEGET